jgi:hypothetical protein
MRKIYRFSYHNGRYLQTPLVPYTFSALPTGSNPTHGKHFSEHAKEQKTKMAFEE